MYKVLVDFNNILFYSQLFIYIFRSNICSLEKLSSTEVKCYWSKQKKSVEEQYEAKPLLETTCFSSLVHKTEELTAEQQKKCFETLIGVCKESALSLHL